MKTSITEIIRIERFLAGRLADADRKFFEERLVVDRKLQRDVFLHRLVHRLVRLYHRQKIKGEVARVQLKLFDDPAKATFRQSVLQYFKS